jgi:integration host factor subunit alpha
MALTKNDIVNKVNDLGFTKKKSVEVVESLLEIIKGTLSKGDDVLVSGFGKFCVKAKRPRRGRNPATGEDLILRQRKVVTFKCSGKLRDRVNDSVDIPA